MKLNSFKALKARIGREEEMGGRASRAWLRRTVADERARSGGREGRERGKA